MLYAACELIESDHTPSEIIVCFDTWPPISRLFHFHSLRFLSWFLCSCLVASADGPAHSLAGTRCAPVGEASGASGSVRLVRTRGFTRASYGGGYCGVWAGWSGEGARNHHHGIGCIHLLSLCVCVGVSVCVVWAVGTWVCVWVVGAWVCVCVCVGGWYVCVGVWVGECVCGWSWVAAYYGCTIYSE